MTMRSEEPTTGARGYEKGQRLYCRKCQSELEITNPSSRNPAELDLRCCGEPMTPEVGVAVNVSVEG